MDGQGVLWQVAAGVGVAVYLLVLVGLGLLVVRAVTDREDRRYYGGLFAAAFVARLLVATFLLDVLPGWVPEHPYLADGYLGDDARLYDVLAVRGLDAWESDKSPFEVYKAAASSMGRSVAPAPGWVLLNTLLYTLLGQNRFAAAALNAFFGALTSVFVGAIARRFFSRPTARLSGGLVAFFPDHVLYAASQLKDTSITAAFMAGLWAVVRRAEVGAGKSTGLLVLLGASSVYLTATRFYYVPVLLVAFFFYNRRSRLRSIPLFTLATRGVLLVAIAGGSYFVLYALLDVTALGLLNPLQMLDTMYSGFVQAGGEGSFYNIFQPPLNIILLPLAMVFVLLNPFVLWPFFNREPVYWLLFPAMLAWYVLLPFALWGGWQAFRQHRARVLVGLILLVLVLLTVSGSGLIASGRTKLPISPLILMFVAVALREPFARRPGRSAFVAAYAMLLSCGLVLYLLVR